MKLLPIYSRSPFLCLSIANLDHIIVKSVTVIKYWILIATCSTVEECIQRKKNLFFLLTTQQYSTFYCVQFSVMEDG